MNDENWGWHDSGTKRGFTFSSFVPGKSSQLAHTIAMQVAENPCELTNPLTIYGGAGLGKTHLLHAIGNAMLARNPDVHVLCLHSERFVSNIVKALQMKTMREFRSFYRSVDVLLIDDIQFFEEKYRSQEEFFHTINALLDSGKQVVVTCDHHPMKMHGLEERLRSLFVGGLTVAVHPPELEACVSILIKKSEELHMGLPHDVVWFIAQNFHSNVRALEGALKLVIAYSNFYGQPIDVELVKCSLKDLIES